MISGNIGLVNDALAFLVGSGVDDAFLACGDVHLREPLLLSWLTQRKLGEALVAWDGWSWAGLPAPKT